jgi:hypothetical protein
MLINILLSVVSGLVSGCVVLLPFAVHMMKHHGRTDRHCPEDNLTERPAGHTVDDTPIIG